MLSKVCKAKNFLFLGVVALLVYMFLEPQKALLASRQGLLLWFQTLLPTLLPFMILSNLVIHLNVAEKLLAPLGPFFRKFLCLSPAGTYGFLLGLLCGYPMGAKLTADLYIKRRISRSEAMYLLTFSNNPSPVFLSTYVLLQCLRMPQYTIASFAILYAADYAASLVFRVRYAKSRQPQSAAPKAKRKEIPPLPSAGKLLDISIMNAFETITRLGGFIILFSVLSSALEGFLFSVAGNAAPCLLGILEISTGLQTVAAASWRPAAKYVLSMGLTSLGGLCILAQTNTVIGQARLPLRPYLEGKLLSGALTVAFSLLFIQIIQFV